MSAQSNGGCSHSSKPAALMSQYNAIDAAALMVLRQLFLAQAAPRSQAWIIPNWAWKPIQNLAAGHRSSRANTR